MMSEGSHAVAFLDKAHRDAGDRAFNGMPASIIASEAPQTLAIDEDPFDSSDLGNDPDGVGEAVGVRHHRMDRAPRELAMADFAAAGRAHAANLANRVWRKIVVKQEGLL